MNELKVFTLKEANQLLPVLTQLILDLQKKRDGAAKAEIQIDSLEIISNPDNSSTHELDVLVDTHRQLVSEFYSIVDQIHERGVFLKDADLGLIDFYGIVSGKVVYLCWCFGEPEISHWHEVGQGYSNRQPLIPD